MTYNPYENICRLAVQQDDIFNNFKNLRDYTYVLEHKNYGGQGQAFLSNIVKKRANILQYLPWKKFQENDLVGNPEVYNYLSLSKYIKLDHYNFSPTTLRYVMIGLDMVKFLENDMNIIEIGGGYGGQCKILYDLARYFNVRINSYTIVDLESSSKLQRKYLERFDLDVVCLHECPNKKYDFVISNYALGEFPINIQNVYIENIVKNSSHGYIIWNSEELHDYFSNFNIEAEVPLTGKHNRIITF